MTATRPAATTAPKAETPREAAPLEEPEPVGAVAELRIEETLLAPDAVAELRIELRDDTPDSLAAARLEERADAADAESELMSEDTDAAAEPEAEAPVADAAADEADESADEAEDTAAVPVAEPEPEAEVEAAEPEMTLPLGATADGGPMRNWSDLELSLPTMIWTTQSLAWVTLCGTWMTTRPVLRSTLLLSGVMLPAWRSMMSPLPDWGVQVTLWYQVFSQTVPWCG